ncbi:MAG: hypothetical protein ACQEXN_15720 [Actinomycetota bacterium]
MAALGKEIRYFVIASTPSSQHGITCILADANVPRKDFPAFWMSAIDQESAYLG